MQESAAISSIKGIGPKSAQVYEKAGIRTLGDLVRYYPRSYDSFKEPVDVSSLTLSDDGQTVAVEGRIARALSVRFLHSFKIVTGKILSREGEIDVTWYNMPFLRSQIHPGKLYVFRGAVRARGKKILLQQPKVYDPEDYRILMKNLQPVYPLVKGLTENSLRKSLKLALYGEDPVDLSEEYLPEAYLEKYELKKRQDSVRNIHFPADTKSLAMARKRLVFDEFFFFILMLRRLKSARLAENDGILLERKEETDILIHSLPYQLTNAQKRAWSDISSEIAGGRRMARLVQGDVGSGKTIIAFLALVQTAANGMQGALMVPTEVLARQHFDAFNELCRAAGLNYHPVLLTGSLKASEKKAIYRQIESGESLIVIGTHALIQEKVNYKCLSLVVTDEQHRFGVNQRAHLEEKGEKPHSLIMSATPIPRTLAVILYGDLDVSVIDELPAGRLPIKNAVVDTSWRPKAYQFIAGQLKQGHQAYLICPMVEESEEIEAENVMDYAETLKTELLKYLPQVNVAYLHGRMKAAEKNDIMERFVSGEIQVLVSTTVIEVGVNVPNATLMMIENSERFGLAQLHQLRGRVGRGKDQSWCIFMHTAKGEDIDKRLEILGSSNDGFEIASKDLKLRGPGELFGIRQSGDMVFELADIYADADVMKCAREAADSILENDPQLESRDFQAASRELKRLENRHIVL